MKVACNTMKGACLVLLGLVLGSTGIGFAGDITQTSFDKLADVPSVGSASTTPFKDETAPNPPPTMSAAGMASTAPCMNNNCACDDCYDPGRFWFRGEYMHWWTNGSHVPPLVSTVTDLRDPNNTLETSFGARTIRDGDHDGYRMDMGMWLDCSHCWGLEGDYYDLRGRPDGFDSGLSNGFNNGVPFPRVRAFFNPTIDPNTEDPIGTQVNAVAFPNQYVGRVTVDTGDYLQSAGLWLRRNLRSSEWSTNGRSVLTTDACGRTFRLDAIAGYRFMRMIDFVNIRDDEMNVNAADATNYLTLFTDIDNFRTVNNFNGFEFGLDGAMTAGRWSLDIVGKMALGVNNQDITLFGLVQADASNTGGGIQASSITEELSLNRFSWIPEMTITAGYQLNDYIKLTAGYDILYWSQVARAGNQIASDPGTGLPLGPQPALTPGTVSETFFWAQGFRLGGEVRF